MKQQKSENYLAYEAAIDAMRTAQTEFELRRGEVVSARERANRVGLSTKEAEADAADAKLRWDEAFRGADGIMNPELKKLRSMLRDAQDVVEDFKELLAEAEATVRIAELPALEAARKLEVQRVIALEKLAESEIEKAFAEIAPRLVRASAMIDAARRPSHLTASLRTITFETDDALIGQLRTSMTRVPVEGIELPRDLGRPLNIAPLRWADANSFVALQKRKAEAKEAAADA
jgi:hypothetical protein